MKTYKPFEQNLVGKQSTRTPLFALAIVVGLFAALKVRAASQTWSNAPTDANWTTAANWVGNAVPGALNNSGTADIVTFNAPLPISGIGGAANPIVVDTTRSVRSFLFDTADCGAYVIGVNDGVTILYGSNNGNVMVNPAVTNAQTFAGIFRVRIPSSTNARYDFTNNATSAAATLYFQTVFN